MILTLAYQDATHWRWILSDAAGRFLADQDVALDRADPVYRSFTDLPGQMSFYEGARHAEDVLAELGAWMGARIFGAVGEGISGGSLLAGAARGSGR